MWRHPVWITGKVGVQTRTKSVSKMLYHSWKHSSKYDMTSSTKINVSLQPVNTSRQNYDGENVFAMDWITRQKRYTQNKHKSPNMVLMLFSVPWDGNQCLEDAIFRPWRPENKELCSIFSVHGDGHLAYSMLFSVPRDGNHSLENAVFRRRKIRSCVRYFPSLGTDI